MLVHPRVPSFVSVPTVRHARCSPGSLVFCFRPTRIRRLQLYTSIDGRPDPRLVVADLEVWPLLARSRFQSLDDAERFAVYSTHGVEGPQRHAIGLIDPDPDRHTLMAVREFRRVPLDASALGLHVFTARAGRAAAVTATLAHFAERAVSSYQPSYLLLAHSLEQPHLTVLLTAVHVRHALQAASPAAFSIASLLPELEPILAAPPEVYAYCPDMPRLDAPPTTLVSRDAV